MLRSLETTVSRSTVLCPTPSNRTMGPHGGSPLAPGGCYSRPAPVQTLGLDVPLTQRRCVNSIKCSKSHVILLAPSCLGSKGPKNCLTVSWTVCQGSSFLVDHNWARALSSMVRGFMRLLQKALPAVNFLYSAVQVYLRSGSGSLRLAEATNHTTITHTKKKT